MLARSHGDQPVTHRPTGDPQRRKGSVDNRTGVDRDNDWGTESLVDQPDRIRWGHPGVPRQASQNRVRFR